MPSKLLMENDDVPMGMTTLDHLWNVKDINRTLGFSFSNYLIPNSHLLLLLLLLLLHHMFSSLLLFHHYHVSSTLNYTTSLLPSTSHYHNTNKTLITPFPSHHHTRRIILLQSQNHKLSWFKFKICNFNNNSSK